MKAVVTDLENAKLDVVYFNEVLGSYYFHAGSPEGTEKCSHNTCQELSCRVGVEAKRHNLRWCHAEGSGSESVSHPDSEAQWIC